MKTIKNSRNNFFSYALSGSNWSLSILLLIVFSVKTFAQIHISDNTLISIKEGTVFYVKNEKTEITDTRKETAKIYIAQNTKVINLLTDSLVEIVYLINENQPKSSKHIAQQKKKINRPLQPPIVKKDTQPEKKSVLSFNSRGKSPASSLLYAGQASTVALINTGNFSIKTFSQSKAHNNSIHIFFLNDAQPLIAAFTDVYLQHQIHSENQITRPPPILIA